ncbi:MAG: PTS fructose transporter subunit IIA [Gammaproteobacteria bacterium]|nr:PTS fructose transporter subunit IIA [Gammaproteobacteria bacterium]|tara:strand:+ start:199 stop:648 length:450 start_codon:yes stop_codon:yes gene_type:complete
MDIKKYLLEDSIMVDVETSSKKNVLELISQKLSKITTSNEDEIFEKLYEREKLGTTAFGKGIAIPHARIDGITKAYVLIFKLKKPIDFDSNDGEKVDLLFSLLVPNEKNDLHIELLSEIASMLDNKIFREKMRQAKNESEIESLIHNYQ